MAMTPAEQNRLMRELLIRNSPKILKKLPTVTGTLGGTTRVKLNNTGLITRLFADISIPYNFSVSPTLSNKGAYASVPKVQLIDFDGSTRINTSAFHLSVLNSVRKRGNFGNTASLQSEQGFTSTATGYANDFKHPQLSTATGAQTLRFILEIPVAAHTDTGDLRGMLPAQFVSGDLQLAFDFAAALNGSANDDYVFSGGTFVSAGTPTVTVYQEYYLPQKIKGVTPIPQDDISTVYEIGVFSRTTDNIAAGQEKLVNFPIVREVNGVITSFLNNSLLGGGSAANDILNHTVYANGNNILYQTDAFTQNYIERSYLGEDLPQGVNAFDFASGPISTAIFANVQLALTPQGAMTTPAVETTFESFYAKGSALSGAPV